MVRVVLQCSRCEGNEVLVLMVESKAGEPTVPDPTQQRLAIQAHRWHVEPNGNICCPTCKR